MKQKLPGSQKKGKLPPIKPLVVYLNLTGRLMRLLWELPSQMLLTF